jgi:tetratricopeptide (TPR) repeat protein
MALHRFTLAAIALAVLAIPAAWAGADVIHLKDGTSITGDIKKTSDGWTVIDARGKSHRIANEAVKMIEPSRTSADARLVGMDRLASLRRSVENLTDVKTIIDRFEKFVEQNKDNKPVVAEASKDLGVWKERLERGMVKVGNRWVGPEEKAKLQEQSLLVIGEARELLKQNKLREAQATLEKAVAVDPNNGSALYLKGLILYRQDKINDARKAFEAVRETMPDHGPTLNNLAIILWRQNQHLAALNVYDQAMQVMPLNKDLLNNVAEALNALTPKEQEAPLAQKVYRRWNEQDTQLQAQMAPLGWYRWGATWVTKDQYDKLQESEKKVKDAIAELEKQFADAETKIAQIDEKIRQNTEAMNWMQRDRLGQDSAGRVFQAPLPALYWEYDRANRRLEVQRKETIALMENLRAKAHAVKQQFPIPKYTGAQVPIGVEGTPAIPPTNAAEPKPANLQDHLNDARPAPKSTPSTTSDASGNPLDKAADAPKPAETPKTPEPAKKTDNRPLKY